MKAAAAQLRRRDFFRLAGLALACSSVPLLSTCGRGGSDAAGIRSARNGRRVLVIGAGTSGLAAAGELRRRGTNVVVIEGRNRIGGRVLTDRSLGSAIDIGASWIHGERGNPITEIARRAGVHTFVTDFDSGLIGDAEGGEFSDEEIAAFEERFAAGLARVVTRSRGDLSVEEAARRAFPPSSLSAREVLLLEHHLWGYESEHGGSVNRLSARYLDGDEAFDGDDLLFPDGYEAVIAALGQGLDVRLDESVTRISWGGAKVVVETTRGRHEGDAVIITLPLGVLKRGAVEFSPDLPEEKQAAIARLGMGVLNKVALRFERVFWPANLHWFELIGEAEPKSAVTSTTCVSCHGSPDLRRSASFSEFVNQVPVNGAPILIALSGGSLGHRLESWSDRECAAACMVSLRTLFGDEAPDPNGVLVSRWHLDSFSGGAYPHVPVGASMEDFETLAEPVDGKLYFAGDGTHAEYPSTVHGAYLSGIREARRA